MIEEVVLKTGKSGHLMGQSNAIALVALPLALWSGQIDAMHRYSTTLRVNLDRENIALWEPVQIFYSSLCRHISSQTDAVFDMRSAIDQLVDDRFLARVPMYLGVLSECMRENGRHIEAEEALDSALKIQAQTQEIWCFPELLRVKAQNMVAKSKNEEAWKLLETALKMAGRTGAKFFRVRIANDMAGMLIAAGNNDQAVELLGPLIRSFGDRTATEDMKRSGRLLATASSRVPSLLRAGLPLLTSYSLN
jgi:tetratricopeptide (TPR) repeat protein